MNILQLSISYSLDGNCLDSDLAETLVKSGHKVTVAFLDPKIERYGGVFIEQKGVEILRIKTMPLQKIGKIRKTISYVTAPHILWNTIKSKLGDRKFDVVLFETPPITMQSTVKKIMRHYGIPSFLMLKDIFPQGGVDMKAFGKFSLPYLYFRAIERKMLKISTGIGCMSQGNADYILKHNTSIPKSKVFVFPNTAILKPYEKYNSEDFRRKYDIPQDACIFLFGGNLGIPQFIPLLEKTILNFENTPNIYFFVVGAGTDAHIIKKFIADGNFKNAKFMDAIPRNEYALLANACDVGLVTLRPNYTIPNYPSKTLSYMAAAMPICAATDMATDYKDLIQTQAKCGLWAFSDKPEEFFVNIQKLADNPQLRKELGLNGRKYLEDNFTTDRSVKIIESFMENLKLR